MKKQAIENKKLMILRITPVKVAKTMPYYSANIGHKYIQKIDPKVAKN